MNQISKVFEMVVDPSEVSVEDSGMAKFFEIEEKPYAMNGMFVKVISWDESLAHTDFNEFIGKKVKITIETIE